LNPNDVKEAAKVDMIADHVEDIREPYIKMIYYSYVSNKFQLKEHLFIASALLFCQRAIKRTKYCKRRERAEQYPV
jgi:hypothetical protein